MNVTSQTLDGVSCHIEQDENAKPLAVPDSTKQTESKSKPKPDAQTSDYALTQAAAGGEMAVSSPHLFALSADDEQPV
jgi:hypothetical protein